MVQFDHSRDRSPFVLSALEMLAFPISNFCCSLILSKEVENLEQDQHDWLQMVQFDHSRDRSPFLLSALEMLPFPISNFCCSLILE